VNDNCLGASSPEIFFRLLDGIPADDDDQYDAAHRACVTVATAEELVRTADTLGCRQAVVGLPLDKDGTETHQARVTRLFVAVLCSVERYFDNGAAPGGRPIFLWDERYSSREAEARIMAREKTGGRFGRKDQRSMELDADSAAIILEHFYQEEGKGAEAVNVADELSEAVERARKDRMDGEEIIRAAMAVARKDDPVQKDRDKTRREAMKRAAEMEKDMGLEVGGGAKKKKKKKKKKK